MEEYKREIETTRIGCLGGSDGKLLQQVASLKYIPKSAYKRLAVCKGLIPQDNVSTQEMRFGDFIEQMIYDTICRGASVKYVSNPLWESEKYTRKNVKLICHPDIVRIDEEGKTIYVYEVKTTKFDVTATKSTYRAQMFIEWTLAHELARKYGKDWKVYVYLVHYDTNGVDISNEEQWEFDGDRMSMHRITLSTLFDIGSAMDIIDTFLEDYTEYYDGDEVDGNLLPEKVKTEFDQVTTFLAEIKEREKKVEDFKKKLCSFMQEKGVKAIKTDAWSITLVNESESVNVDYKAIFANEIEAKKPRVANKLKKQYKKVTKKKAYVKISTRENETKNGL